MTAAASPLPEEAKIIKPSHYSAQTRIGDAHFEVTLTDKGQAGDPCRSFTEFEYSTLNSWSKARRLIGKAEILSKGENPRFIVSNLPKDGRGNRPLAARFEPPALYEEFYCARGDLENASNLAFSTSVYLGLKGLFKNDIGLGVPFAISLPLFLF